MKIAGQLNFDTKDNACLSLRNLAERVRTGDIKIGLFDARDTDGYIRVDMQFTPDPKRGTECTSQSLKQSV
jgi:hypothetical protein